MNSPLTIHRRRFLKYAGLGLALLAPQAEAGTFIMKKFLSLPSKETPFITPNDLFYTVQYAGYPQVDVKDWTLEIGGRVARPLRLRYEDILKRPAVTKMVTLQCIDNEVAGELISNAVWKGVSLKSLIEEARPHPSAVDVAMHGADLYSDSIPLDRALNYDVFLAYEMNGVPLPKKHGFPLRTVVPGVYGIKNVKWLTKIDITDYDYKGYWQQKGWTDDGFIKVSSRIDAPGPYNTLRGGTLFRGIAFGGYNGIRSVELSFDGGKQWRPARIDPSPSRYAWVRWQHDWRAPRAGSYQVYVRATHHLGESQTDFMARAFPEGTSGLHSVVVFVE